MSARGIASLLMAVAATGLARPAAADQLYDRGSWSALAGDRKAAAVGDGVVVVIYVSTQASSKLENDSSRKSQVGGGLQAGSLNENANLALGGSYDGKGEVTRSEQFVAQMSATVTTIMPNGDFVIEGQQHMLINGENTSIGVRGHIRPQDISADNAIISSRITDAQINYDGKGFVSRSAKPGLINRIFGFLGLG